jgi:site-specific DNA-methyltransferase (adenine-specific)
MKYKVTIQETLARSVLVEADSQGDAELAARRMYRDSKIILDSGDYLDTDYRVSPLEPYYRSPNNDFTLIQGDCVDTLSRFQFGFDMVFADPPYFLSGGGISCQSGRVVCVDKGDWDKPKSPEEMDDFNYRWIRACRDHMKDNATIWISGTYHNIFSVQQQLIKLGFKILNVITWAKTNPPPNISCRYFTYSTEFIIWARKQAKTPHYFNYALMKELNGDKQMTDVWRLPAIGQWEKSCGKHPTQKPLALLARIVMASTRQNAWILDPFAGSSTTGIAASMLGRRFLGLEIEDEYLAMGKARREELEHDEIRNGYLRRLEKAHVIPSTTRPLAAEATDTNDDAPWL